MSDIVYVPSEFDARNVIKNAIVMPLANLLITKRNIAYSHSMPISILKS